MKPGSRTAMVMRNILVPFFGLAVIEELKLISH